MESIQDIRTRLKSIASTQQITQSMRLVSQAKVQRARQKMDQNRPFFEQISRTMNDLGCNSVGSKHPYLLEREKNRSLIIVISSDRGLCGGYNINICKEAIALAKRLGEVEFITIGSKVREYCRRRKKSIHKSYQSISENPFYADAKEIADLALELYNSGQIDQLYLVYTQYVSMLTLTPKSVRLLPLTVPEQTEKPALMRYEPGEENFLGSVTPMYLSAYIFGALLESAACEQASRITSMDAAVKNSTEMIDSLTLQYNRVRQGAITQELTEIVGGANALEK